jgi:hypothetical protein
VGKALIPLPPGSQLSPILPRPQLADYQLPQLTQTLSAAGPHPRALLASGDVWLDFNASEIPLATTDFTGVGMRVSPEIAQHFGVYFVPKTSGRHLANAVRTVSFFRQKPAPSEIRRFDASYDFYVDSGIWLLSPRAIELMFRRCGWSQAEQRFVSDSGLPTPLDLYTEFGGALGTETKAPVSLKKLGFCELTSGVIPLDAARFYHLGSNRQLLESMEDMQRSSASPDRFFRISSPAEKFLLANRAAAWVEASQPAKPVRLAGANLLTGLPPAALIQHLPASACLDIAPVGAKAFVLRPYHIDDTTRGLPATGGKICGQDAATWLTARNMPAGKIDVFDLPLYPLLQDNEITQAVFDWFFSETPDPAMTLDMARREKISARAIADRIHFGRYFAQRTHGYARQFRADFERLIAQGDTAILAQDCAALAEFCLEQSPPLGSWILKNRDRILAAIHRPELQARFLLLLAELRPGAAGLRYSREGFARLQSAMLDSRQLAKMSPRRSLKEDQIVWSRSPVRLDLAGGWTDTPPFCLQSGGTVVNLAVLLNGQPPIQVFVRPTPENYFRLRSIDLGSAETVNTYTELADFRNPGGHFSLPKAALSMAGFLPEFSAGKPHRTLRAHLAALGGGLEISLLSAIPKGSGLGTSSILAATILGALNRA